MKDDMQVFSFRPQHTLHTGCGKTKIKIITRVYQKRQIQDNSMGGGVRWGGVGWGGGGVKTLILRTHTNCLHQSLNKQRNTYTVMSILESSH